MIDYFTLALTHGLMALALWRLLFRPDLDEDGVEQKPARRPWVKSGQKGAQADREVQGDA